MVKVLLEAGVRELVMLTAEDGVSCLFVRAYGNAEPVFAVDPAGE